jgi:hypothetical protein
MKWMLPMIPLPTSAPFPSTVSFKLDISHHRIALSHYFLLVPVASLIAVNGTVSLDLENSSLCGRCWFLLNLKSSASIVTLGARERSVCYRYADTRRSVPHSSH